MDNSASNNKVKDKGRRRFLAVGGAVGLLWLGAAAYPVYKFISPQPVPDPFGEEGRAVVKKLTAADCARPGSGGNGSIGNVGVIVFRDMQGELRAFTSKCTHAGCNVNFTGDKIVCHCHGGVYNLDGVNVAGPPPKPLTRLKAFEENGVLYVAPFEETEKA